MPVVLSKFARGPFPLKLNIAVSFHGSGPGGTLEANMFTQD